MGSDPLWCAPELPFFRFVLLPPPVVACAPVVEGPAEDEAVARWVAELAETPPARFRF